MKSEIKVLHSPDVDVLETFVPEESDNFCFLLQIMLGIESKDGCESFDVLVCTPKWILENEKENEIIFGLHYLIVFEYNYEKLCKKLEETFCIEADNWEEIGNKLHLYGAWEFYEYEKWKDIIF